MSEAPTLFDDLPVHPYCDHGVPHVAGSDTSAAAAQSQEKTLGKKQAAVLEAIRVNHRLTDDDLEIITGWSHQTVSARRRELVLAGKVVDSGDRKPTRSGRAATVWVIA